MWWTGGKQEVTWLENEKDPIKMNLQLCNDGCFEREPTIFCTLKRKIDIVSGHRKLPSTIQLLQPSDNMHFIFARIELTDFD